MVVDDEPGITDVIADILEFYGHPVVVANDAQTALEILRLRQPEVVLVDLMMPSLDGLSLALALRHHSSAQYLPLIAMSASDSALALAGRMGDFDAYLSKPFETADLVSLVERCMRVPS
jgi:two-component system response regulator MtrA